MLADRHADLETHRQIFSSPCSDGINNAAGGVDDDDVAELIEGLEQLVMEEHYEVEIEMNFKWKTRHRQLADDAAASREIATIN